MLLCCKTFAWEVNESCCSWYLRQAKVIHTDFNSKRLSVEVNYIAYKQVVINKNLC